MIKCFRKLCSANKMLLASLCLCSIAGIAQNCPVNPVRLYIGLDKSTTLVFPQIIAAAYWGSNDILAQKVEHAGQVLEVKAARDSIKETTLTVVTVDGKVWPFTIAYSDSPQVILRIAGETNPYQKVIIQSRSIHSVWDEKYDIILRLYGIYIQDDIVYYQLQLENLSNIPYDMDLLRFFIKDKKSGRRIATQEVDINPIAVVGNTGNVPGQAKRTFVAAFNKFTIPDKKRFLVQIMEKNGGRHLFMKVSNHTIIHAKPLQNE